MHIYEIIYNYVVIAYSYSIYHAAISMMTRCPCFFRGGTDSYSSVPNTPRTNRVTFAKPLLVQVPLFIYIYIYTYIHTHTHIYIYIYTHVMSICPQ